MRHLRELATIAAAAVIATGCTTATATKPAGAPSPASTPWPSVLALPATVPDSPTFEQVLPLFAYQGDRPFDVKIVGTETSGDVTIQDLSFIGASGSRIEAYLVIPAGKGPFPTIVYQHGSAGTREDFKPEAVLTAATRHIAALTMLRPTGDLPDDLSEAAYEVREIRRAIDFVASQPNLDASRIGYFGFSMGAILGLPLTAVEPRVKAAVLSCLVPTFGRPPYSTALFAAQVKTPTYLQFGQFDGLYTREEGEALAALVKDVKVSWYEVGHTAAGMDERTAWLAEKLGA